MASQFVSSVPKENRTGYYRLLTEWSAEKVKIRIASENGAWEGEWPKEKIAETSKQLNQQPEDYLKESKDALTTIDGKRGYVYSVENNQFVWKIIHDEDAGIKVKMGSISLVPSNFQNTIQSMMDVALSTNKNLQATVSKLTTEKSAADCRIEELFKKLSECEQSKIQMDNEYMSQFLAILNSKKIKISELEQQIIVLKSGSSDIPKRKIGRNSKTIVNVDDYNMDTDEDEPQPSSSRNEINSSSAIKSKSSVQEKVIDCAGSIDRTKEAEPCTVTSRETVDEESISEPEVSSSSKSLFGTNSNLLRTKPKDVAAFFFGGDDDDL